MLNQQRLNECSEEKQRREEQTNGHDLIAVLDEVDDQMKDDGTSIAQYVRDQLQNGAGYELSAEDFEEAKEEGRLLALFDAQLNFGKGPIKDELLVVLVHVVVLVGGREFVDGGFLQVLNVPLRFLVPNLLELIGHELS